MEPLHSCYSKEKSTTPGKLVCLQLNADTLTNKLPELEAIIRQYNPDIVGVSEVLPKNYNNKIYPEEFNIQGYNTISHENVPKNSGRGSLMYLKSNINYKEVKFDPKNGRFEEGIFAEIKLTKNNRLLCANIYRRGESDTETNENLLEILKTIGESSYENIIIMGDFNLK